MKIITVEDKFGDPVSISDGFLGGDEVFIEIEEAEGNMAQAALTIEQAKAVRRAIKTIIKRLEKGAAK